MPLPYPNHQSHQTSANQISRARKSCLQFRGKFQVEETENGIKIQIKQPHLINVRVNSKRESGGCCSDDQMSMTKAINEDVITNVNKTSIKIYPLKLGRTTIGSAPNNDIQMQGRGIEARHCYIENSQIVLNDEKVNRGSLDLECCYVVTIYPLAKLCAVDGVLVDRPYVLNTG